MDFESDPGRLRVALIPIKFTSPEQKLVDLEVNRMIEKGAITEVSDNAVSDLWFRAYS